MKLILYIFFFSKLKPIGILKLRNKTSFTMIDKN